MTACNQCGGTRGVEVPTICCKSPLLELAVPILGEGEGEGVYGYGGMGMGMGEGYNFHLSPSVRFSQKGIIMNQGTVTNATGSPYHPDTEVVAVSLRHVWSGKNGFRSKDLKDYMKLPDGVKLVCVSMMKDDVLEEMWEYDMHGGEKFREVGIDYTMPLMFSVYREKGNMSNYFDFRRTYMSLSLGFGDFVPLSYMYGLYVEEEVLRAVEKIKQVIFNVQFLQSDELLSRKLEEVMYWDQVITDRDVAFYFVGPYGAKTVLNIKRICYPRDCYFISVSPWMAALYGKYYTKDGHEKSIDKRLISIHDLLYYNQANFFNVCATDISSLPLTEGEQRLRRRLKVRYDAKRRYFRGCRERAAQKSQ